MTPTAPLTTAADLELAQDVASDWFVSLSVDVQMRLEIEDQARLRDAIAKELTARAAQVRRDAIEECATWCDEAAKYWRAADTGEGGELNRTLRSMQYDTTAACLRELPPGSPSSQTDTGDSNG